MIVAQKAESENEEIWNWVRVRAAVTTKPVDGMAELKHQISQLMAALTQTRWGNSHTSTVTSHRQHGHGCGTVEDAAVVIQTLLTVGVALARKTQGHSLLTKQMGKTWGEWAASKEIEDPVQGERVWLAAETHSVSSATGTRDSATWSKCPTLAYI